MLDASVCLETAAYKADKLMTEPGNLGNRSHFLCTEKKGADKLRFLRAADPRLCFRIYAKIRFSNDEAQIMVWHVKYELAVSC